MSVQPTPVRSPANPDRLFEATVFLAAFLLFLVEPIAAKQLLPAFGGSAAVWITCLVFFQAALLAGYTYAHRLSQKQDIPRHIHTALLALAFLAAIAWSLAPTHTATLTTNPAAAILLRLTLTVGLPFLALGATSPLLQVWAARLHNGQVPYRLYGLSNLASLLALAAYPTLVEPYLTLRAQRLLWTVGFALFALLSIRLARQAARTASNTPQILKQEEEPRSTRRDRLLWVLLPLVASLQLSAVTAHLTANVAAIPLLWILPLAVYLLTLIVSFQFPRLLPQWIILRLLAVMLASLTYLLSKVDVAVPISIGILFYLLELFVAAQFCHSSAYALRPARASETTRFYLYFAAGGALGAFLIGIVFPVLFSANYDLAISFLATAIVAAIVLWPQGCSQRLLWSTASVVLIVLLALQHTAYYHDTLFTERNFYGTLRVQQTYAGHRDPAGGLAPTRILANGTIRHGTQIFTPALVTTPTTYYARDSGIGLALDHCCDNNRPRNIGVIGLGTGTIAAYGRPGDTFRFYEINPAVLPVAQNLFTYLRQSAAHIDIVPGDARASLAAEPPQHFDVLVIDAFSGDAIPLHLLTAEAMRLYLHHLSPNGILAFHVSNQHVDLEPAIARLAENASMQSRTVHNSPNDSLGEFRSTWILLTRNPSFFEQPELTAVATPTRTRPGLRLWTDDDSSLFPLLR